MTMTSRIVAGLAGLLLLLASGCASANTANRLQVEPNGQARITITNSSLQSDIEIVSGRALYEDDVLVVAVELISHMDRKATLEYRFSWRDADDFVLEEDSWSELFVNGFEEKQVQGRATEPNSAQGTFELRRFSGRTDADN